MERLIWTGLDQALPCHLPNLGLCLTVRFCLDLLTKIKRDLSPGHRSKARLLSDTDVGGCWWLVEGLRRRVKGA